jgi:hypothetical protein
MESNKFAATTIEVSKSEMRHFITRIEYILTTAHRQVANLREEALEIEQSLEGVADWIKEMKNECKVNP